MMCTYLEEYEFEKYKTVPNDKELDDLLQEVNKEFGNHYLIEKRTIVTKKWFKKRTVNNYTLYGILSKPEVQVVNLPQAVWIGKRSRDISRASIITYFYGMLNGANHALKNQPVKK